MERISISSPLHTSNPYDLLHEEEQETTFKVAHVKDVGRESPRLFQPNADIQKVECSAQHNLSISNQQVLRSNQFSWKILLYLDLKTSH